MNQPPTPPTLPAALREPGHGPVVVLGGPGTGKTRLATDLVVDRLRRGADPASVLVLVPSRQQGDRLRDELALSSGVTFSDPVVRTFAAHAFDLISRAREAGLIPAATRAPRLLSGAEQDAFIAELLRGHAAGSPGPAWPASLGEAVGTRGFRKELREFLDRAAELSLGAADVEELGRRCGVPEWSAAARFLDEYRQVGALEHAEAFDPAELVSVALGLLRDHPDFAASERSRVGLLVVDDLQEATGSQHRMVRQFARDTDAVLAACPDTVVQGFRGARPDLVRHVGDGLAHGADAPVMELRTNHRLGRALSAAVRRVALRIPTSLGEAGRVWEPARAEDTAVPDDAVPDDALRDDAAPEDAGTEPVDIRLVAGEVQRGRLIARHVLEAHLTHGVPYEDIAVIVRNGSQVREISRALGLDGISTAVPPVEIPLREEAAVRPLLVVLERAMAAVAQGAAAGPVRRDHQETAAAAAAIEALLTGPYGRATTLDVRSLRQALLIAERAAGGERDSTQLLAALLDGVLTADELRGMGPVALPAVRLVDMLTAAVEHLRGDHTPATALWALWEAAHAAATWRAQALGERGLRADRAHRDLDAVLALFQAAERFGDQFPGAGVERFLEHVRSHELPMDSLAGVGSGTGRVQVLTPAAAAGLEWDTVVVAGLEEGLWPSTGLRGQLLRSDDLVTVAEHGDAALLGSTVAQKLRGVRDDELRQFLTAISRARRQVHLIAVGGDESVPSSFLELARTDHTEPLVITPVPRARTLTTLTALLRRTVEQRADATAADAAGVLALLASVEPAVPGAGPGDWWGLAPLSSADPVVPAGAPVRVSPSKVESVMESPMNWFVQAAGGVAPTDFARSLGTLVHSIAEEHPAADVEELQRALSQRWDELRMPENWEGAVERERAERMLGRLAAYFADLQRRGRRFVAAEQGFALELAPRSEGEHPVRLTGSIDRVEEDAEGRPYVADLKTGKVIPTTDEMQEHAQLLTYQAALRAGALDGLDLAEPRTPAGAELVAIGKETSKVTLRIQGPVPAEDSGPEELVADAAALMAAAHFASVHQQGGNSRCTLPGVCPLCDDGRQVTQP